MKNYKHNLLLHRLLQKFASFAHILDLKIFCKILFYSSYKIKLCFSDKVFDVVMVIKANLEINVELNNAKLEYQFEFKRL